MPCMTLSARLDPMSSVIAESTSPRVPPSSTARFSTTMIASANVTSSGRSGSMKVGSSAGPRTRARTRSAVSIGR